MRKRVRDIKVFLRRWDACEEGMLRLRKANHKSFAELWASHQKSLDGYSDLWWLVGRARDTVRGEQPCRLSTREMCVLFSFNNDLDDTLRDVVAKVIVQEIDNILRGRRRKGKR